MKTRLAVVLAAGLGSRLRPLTDDRPKALVAVGGRSLLGRALDNLAEQGVEHLVVATGYRGDAVAAALRDAPLRVTLRPNPDYDTTQNVTSFALCADDLRGEAFFKLDGDVLFMPEVLRRLESSDADLAVAIDGRERVDAEAMKVVVEGERICRFGKQLAPAQAAGETIGIERISADASAVVVDGLIRAVAEGRTDVYYEDVYDELVRRKQLIAAPVEVGDLPWTEVDDPADLARAERLFGQG
ncbi:MAG: phosphocholine cytidylyltransferase family protein [Polyangiaceae bacterium]|nr:phosphocholine cytidylyltransferase family protein [Polyangiaceae bacterium]